MEILLLQDVENLGAAGEVHKVAPGYARNFLIPKRLAMPATAGAKKQAEQVKRTAEKRRDSELAAARDLSRVIEAQMLEFQMRVGEKGRLYGSVTSGDIAGQLSRKIGREIERRQVQLDEPIKALGDYHIPVRLGQGVVARVKATVLGENGETAADFLPKPEPTVAVVDDQPTYE